MPRRFAMFGLTSIVVTPFDLDGQVDLASLHCLIEATLASGVNGLTALGVAAETHKLSAGEREVLSRSIFEIVAGRSPVTVGASAIDTRSAVENAISAQALGANAVMIAPPYGMPYGETMRRHFADIASSTDLPLIFQDYEAVTGVRLEPIEMAELITAVPSIRAIKLESEPTAARIRETRSICGDDVYIVGGIGAIHFHDELVAGADGTMTGFAYPEILIAIERAWRAGEREAAKRIFNQYEPLISFEGQPGIGLGVRKEILRQRNRIATAIVRDAPPLAASTLDALTAVIRSTGASIEFDKVR